jgi:serine/threonine-protein kinase
MGDRLGPYRLEVLLGDGATGAVYRALDGRTGTTVALKLLRADLSENPVFVARFEREARIARESVHPHLVPVLDAGAVDGRHYLATAYVDGTTLERLVSSSEAMRIGDALRIVAEVASALDVLHARGVVHRDVKPSNVLLDTERRSLLTDFGLAKGPAYTVLTRPGQLLGTPHYLAPELVRGEPATRAGDVYALGCLAYACLTGSPPFTGTSLIEVTVAHLDAEPPDIRRSRPDATLALAAALTSALAKEPARRPRSAGAYALALLRAQG